MAEGRADGMTDQMADRTTAGTADAEEMKCPKCSGTMRTHALGEVRVTRCGTCAGVFLDRAELGMLSEAENDWHRGSSSHTEPLPRITPGMTAPPPARRRARSFIETLFQ